MNRNLKLVINNIYTDKNSQHFFEKNELKIILDLYAKMVSEGSWRDYGLNISNKQVGFCVFKNATEKSYPILVIVFSIASTIIVTALLFTKS